MLKKIPFQTDIEDIQSLSIIPTILDVICESTQMGFAAIARVTEDTWITCGVLDKLSFGLSVGDELDISTTFCNQVRKTDQIVVIDHVDTDNTYVNHPIPKQYGFQSYISVPIIKKNGEFFGTLCALDLKPNKVNNAKVIDMFNMFSGLISSHLDVVKTMNSQVDLIKKKEDELENYSFITSHDLQEPLRKIQFLTDLLEHNETRNLSKKGKKLFNSIKTSATRMRNIVNDLLKYSQNAPNPNLLEDVKMHKLILRVEFRLIEIFKQNNSKLIINDLGKLPVLPLQMEQLFFNLFSNSLKFKHPERDLVITINSTIASGANFNVEKLLKDVEYCEIEVTDNGIGFDPIYSEKIFKMFQYLKHSEDNKSTGMGLAIAKRIAHNHEGEIIATSIPYVSTTIKIYIPTTVSYANLN